MNRLVLLLEEPSMKVFLEILLPRFFPAMPFICIKHEGKQDLEQSIPRKLRAWKEPGVRFLILRDNDGGNCLALKQSLQELARERAAEVIIRIACQELEAWYLGEPGALAQVYDQPALAGLNQRARFRDPDAVLRPAQALAELIPDFQKVSGARKMAQALSPENNGSVSFRAFWNAIESCRMAYARSMFPVDTGKEKENGTEQP